MYFLKLYHFKPSIKLKKYKVEIDDMILKFTIWFEISKVNIFQDLIWNFLNSRFNLKPSLKYKI